MRAGLAVVPVIPRGRQAKQPKSNNFPAPVGGWATAESYVASNPLTARVMDNWFPEKYAIRMRLGALKAATIGTDPVTSMFTSSRRDRSAARSGGASAGS